MTLFKDEARYPDMTEGYALYRNRSANTPESRIMDMVTYSRVVKKFCRELSERLEAEGMTDFPSDMGSVAAVRIRKKPVYDRRTGRFRPSCSVDWNETRRIGTIVKRDGGQTLGFVFLPKRTKGRDNFRCFGIRANKALYRRMKSVFDGDGFDFYLADIETYL